MSRGMYALSPADVASPIPVSVSSMATSMTPPRHPGRMSGAGYPGPRASAHRPVLGRLRGAADRPPAGRGPTGHGEGRRLGLDPRRRPGLQAAELDEPAVPDRRGDQGVAGG